MRIIWQCLNVVSFKIQVFIDFLKLRLIGLTQSQTELGEHEMRLVMASFGKFVCLLVARELFSRSLPRESLWSLCIMHACAQCAFSVSAAISGVFFLFFVRS